MIVHEKMLKLSLPSKYVDLFYIINVQFFLRKNQRITLEEFKWIWFMEYGHRMWGRLIGAVFLIPAGIFWYQKKLTPSLKRKIIMFGSLIAAQVN